MDETPLALIGLNTIQIPIGSLDRGGRRLEL
jgi:hypothetical protein